ncbi:hypothetical protein HDU76_008852, partial [Blyttiomyces sp. JEL0837]
MADTNSQPAQTPRIDTSAGFAKLPPLPGQRESVASIGSLHSIDDGIETVEAAKAEAVRLRELVRTLEEKAAGLESKLADSKERHARDKANATEDIQKKNAVIDIMRVKLNRYEFALKEAILFLAKPMEAYESWLNNRGGNNGLDTGNSPTSAGAHALLASAVAAAAGSTNSANTIGASPTMQHQPAASPMGLAASSPTVPPNTHASKVRQQEGGTRSRAGSSSRPGSALSPGATAPAGPNGPSERPVSPSPLHPSGASSASLFSQSDALSSKPQGPTTLEIQCLECMRLALNYLKNAQTSVQNMPKDGTETNIVSLPKLVTDLHDGEGGKHSPSSSVAVQASSTVSGASMLSSSPLSTTAPELSTSASTTEPTPHNQHDAHDHLQPSPHSHHVQSPSGSTAAAGGAGSSSPAQPHSTTTGSSSATTPSGPAATAPHSRARMAALARLNSPERRATNAITTQAVLHAAVAAAEELDSDVGDITSGGVGLSSNSQALSELRKCPNCREIMLQLDHEKDTVDKLREDVTILANQLEEERGLRDRIQLSKDILDQELEELTAQLFDQANRMVIDEARMREELEFSNRDLRGELKDLVKKFDSREEELKDLRKNLRALEAAKLRAANLSVMTSPFGSISNLAGVSGGGASGTFGSQGGLNLLSPTTGQPPMMMMAPPGPPIPKPAIA